MYAIVRFAVPTQTVTLELKKSRGSDGTPATACQFSARLRAGKRLADRHTGDNS